MRGDELSGWRDTAPPDEREGRVIGSGTVFLRVTSAKLERAVWTRRARPPSSKVAIVAATSVALLELNSACEMLVLAGEAKVGVVEGNEPNERVVFEIAFSNATSGKCAFL